MGSFTQRAWTVGNAATDIATDMATDTATHMATGMATGSAVHANFFAYIHTYVGCERYIDVLCAPAGTTQRNGQQHRGTPYSSSHSRRYSSRHSRYRSPCARGLRIERARAKEAAAGVGKAAVRGRAPSLPPPPGLLHCFTASLLHYFTASYWLLAAGYWLSLCKSTATCYPGQPG